MLRGFTKAILTAALLAVTARASATGAAVVDELCSLPTASLAEAATLYPDCAAAVAEVSKHAIATWYTDRESPESYAKKVKDITATCSEDSRLTLVVYGLPNKDCEAGYSTGGVNQTPEDYKKWVQELADGVGERKALYVLEPDAVGLLAKGGCGVNAGYAENVKVALEILSKNPNADIYLDVGYWTLLNDADAAGIAKTVKDLAQVGRVKGITLNTSNYRTNQEISGLCANFQKAYGDDSLHCIVDTSRNYKEPSSSEWCNAKFGGIGQPPTSETGFDNLDYFIWIKPAGESDGTCDGENLTKDAMKGPGSGKFFKDHFVTLWNNGYFVDTLKMPVIDGTIQEPVTPVPSTPATTDYPTEAPVSSEPTPTEPASTEPTPTEPASTEPTPTEPAPVSPTPTTTAPVTSAPTDSESEAPISNPDTPSVTPAATPTPTTTAPSVDSPDYSPPPVAQQLPTPAPSPIVVEARSAEETPAPTPKPSKKKKNKGKKKCESGLEPLPEDLLAEADDVSTVSAADVNATADDETAKAVSLSINEPQAAPVIIGEAPAAEASTKAGAESSSGLSGTVIGAIVVAAVAAVAAAAVALRRTQENRRRADTLRTPVEAFGQLEPTPAQVTVL